MFLLPHLICTTETVYSTSLDLYDYSSAPPQTPTEKIRQCRPLMP